MDSRSKLIAFAVLVASCSSVRGPGGGAVSGDASAEFRALYDSGFNHIMAAVPDNAQSLGLSPLQGLGRFRTQRVAWAGMKGNAYYAIEPGRSDGGWLVIVPSGSDVLKSMKSTLEMDPGPTVAAVLIKQEKVSEVWAGLFLTHELSHLADRVLKVEPPNPTRAQFLMGELRAYDLELMGADLVSAGRLRQHLDAILDRWQLESVASVTERCVHLGPPELAALNDAVPGGDPQSAAEARLRGGFFAAALVLRFSERNRLPDETVLDGLDRLLAVEPEPRTSVDPRPNLPLDLTAGMGRTLLGSDAPFARRSSAA